MLPGHIASMYKLPEPQKQLAKLDVPSFLGCKEGLQLLLELLSCIAHNRLLKCQASIANAGSYVGTMPLHLMFVFRLELASAVLSAVLLAAEQHVLRHKDMAAGLTMILQKCHFFFVLFGICLSSLSLSLLSCFTFQLPLCHLNQ